MRRTVTVATLVAVMFAGPSADALIPLGTSNETRPAPCSHIRWRKGVEQRERLIRCVFRRLNPTVALAVARCESGPTLDPRASHHGSLGLFQHQGWLWRSRAIRYLSSPRYRLDPMRVSPFNAYANAVVTAGMVADRDIRWTPWSCA